MQAFITGSAGFIGFHLARRLLAEGHSVTGFDALTPYYDVALKEARHAELTRYPAFHPVIGALEDKDLLATTVAAATPDIIVHLAAQAGVRYSLEAPEAYLSANLIGTFNLLEAARAARPRHLLVASTSSVYGANPEMPFRETARTDFPLSLYAATKQGAEAMTHVAAHLHGLPTTCFRFFTVYGPWGRPDMALFKFTRAIVRDDPIEVYGDGTQRRDFTYIGDLVEAVIRLIDQPPARGQPVQGEGIVDSLSPAAPWRSVNIAGGMPVSLADFIAAIERALGRTAQKIVLPMQPGDVAATHADPRLLEVLTGYRPSTPLAEGVAAFVAWYRAHYSQP